MNKEEKNRKYRIGCGHIVSLVWSEKEQGKKYRSRAALLFGGWLTGYTAFLLKQSIYRDMKVF